MTTPRTTQRETQREPVRTKTQRTTAQEPVREKTLKERQDDHQEKLKKFLQSYLPKFIPKKSYIDGMLSDKNFKIWVKAFTHETMGDGYETLEAYGDRYAKAAFTKYFSRAYPHVYEPSIVSSLINYYASKEFYAGISDQEGFSSLVLVDRVINPLPDDVKEDVFESFSGALEELGDLVGEEIDGTMMGANIVYFWTIYLFNNIDLDPERAAGSFQSQIDEFRKTIGLDIFHEELVVDAKDGSTEIIYYYYMPIASLNRYLQEVDLPLYTPDQEKYVEDKNFFYSVRHDGKGQILLGVGKSFRKTTAADDAGRNAVIFLKNLGIKRDDVKSPFRDKNMRSEEAKDDLALVLEQYHDLHLKKLSFTNTPDIIYFLTGISNNSEVKRPIKLAIHKLTGRDTKKNIIDEREDILHRAAENLKRREAQRDSRGDRGEAQKESRAETTPRRTPTSKK